MAARNMISKNDDLLDPQVFRKRNTIPLPRWGRLKYTSPLSPKRTNLGRAGACSRRPDGNCRLHLNNSRKHPNQASLREGGVTRSVTEGVCGTNSYRKHHLYDIRKHRNQAFPTITKTRFNTPPRHHNFSHSPSTRKAYI